MNIGNKIYCYKAPYLNRDNPCVQNNILSLAGCMPNLRKCLRKGDIFVVARSTKNGAPAGILCVARVYRRLSVKKYYALNPQIQKNLFKVRRDCMYGISKKKRIYVMFKKRRSFEDWCYYKNRIKQNIGDKFDKYVVLSKDYKTWFNKPSPRMSTALLKYLKAKQRGIGLPRIYWREILGLLANKRYVKEINPNAYDPNKPTPYRSIPRANKQDYEIFDKTYDFDDIIQEIERTGGIKKTKARKNAKRPGVDVVMSEAIGMVSSFGNTFWSGTTMNRWKLLTMIVSYAEKEWDLILGDHYTGINMNCNFQCALHVDKNNIGYNYIVGGGTYSGGALIVEGTAHDIKGKLLKFNPKSPHEVAPFTGNRYTLTFFTNKNYN